MSSLDEIIAANDKAARDWKNRQPAKPSKPARVIRDRKLRLQGREVVIG